MIHHGMHDVSLVIERPKDAPVRHWHAALHILTALALESIPDGYPCPVYPVLGDSFGGVRVEVDTEWQRREAVRILSALEVG